MENEKVDVSLHKIFEKSPSLSVDYKNITESNDREYPMLFVSNRWVKKEPVAGKARQKYDQRFLKLLTIGNNASYDHLVTSVEKLLIPVKIIFFEDVARTLKKFLTQLQTDQPIAPFLANTLAGLVRFFMERFLLKSVIDKCHSSISLTKIDLNDFTKQKLSCLMDLTFAVNYKIKLLKSK